MDLSTQKWFSILIMVNAHEQKLKSLVIGKSLNPRCFKIENFSSDKEGK